MRECSLGMSVLKRSLGKFPESYQLIGKQVLGTIMNCIGRVICMRIVLSD